MNGEGTFVADLAAPFVCDAEFAVREYAAETGSFVLSASGYFPKENIADQWREAIPNLQAQWAVGGSSIVAPGGAYLVAPVINQEKILCAELDFDLRRFWKALVDPLGHYSRPDVYSLQLHDVAGREHAYSNLKRTPKTQPLWVDGPAEETVP